MPHFLAGPSRVVVPEIEHCLAEVLDDVAAIEIDVFDERAAILAIKNHVLVLARRAATLDHHSDRIGRAHRSMRDVRRDKKGFALPHEVIDDFSTFTGPHFDVALQLIEILLRVDEVKIVPGIRTFYHHDKKVAPVVEVLIAHRRFEFVAVFFDPVRQIDRWLYFCFHR